MQQNGRLKPGPRIPAPDALAHRRRPSATKAIYRIVGEVGYAACRAASKMKRRSEIRRKCSSPPTTHQEPSNRGQHHFGRREQRRRRPQRAIAGRGVRGNRPANGAAGSSACPGVRVTLAELRKMPHDQRQTILAAAAALAEQDYLSDKDLTGFEAFGEEELDDEESRSP